MAVKVSMLVWRLLGLSRTKPLCEDLEGVPLCERARHMFRQTVVSTSDSVTPNVHLALRPTNRLGAGV